MSKMFYYQHHVGDYNNDTAYLTVLEHGVYRLLLDRYYLNEQPLPLDTDQVCRLARARSDEERAAVVAILNDFFIKEEDGYHQKRADWEIEEYHALVERNQRNGKLGGRPRRKPRKTQMVSSGNPDGTQEEPTGNPDITLTNKPTTQEPTNHKPTPPKPPSSAGAEFERFWSAYPKKKSRGTAIKAFQKARTINDAETIIAAVEANKRGEDWTKEHGRFIPHPASWLNAMGWEDEVKKPTPKY